ncbi:hypothetical protein HWN40_06735 [Methanolobus zinderi]|uniref:Uncharacterized protein n=1 Tax=Methanolobus zinderi TaxID=536044 RepID=A0A7D5I8V7_9EURY|nr:hypothetical protein [Methanolobus zinderi]QLC49962.1 hypothetical protein HWN40_06735 [Methanolobus zinderi]
MQEIETAILSIGIVVNTAINASVWYKLGSIQGRVEECENYKVSPK